ncbi:MAG TPA: cell division protein FtsZ [Chitinophagaceae bacterium]|nr:cell division protein FtsZ [Chitinophagaceae bacterium]
MIHFDLPKEKSSIIKVIGIGGGGSNAVNHMYSQNIEGVNFIICNTDAQAIALSDVPNKVQLGPHLTQGLGAGANPEIGRQATEESLEELKSMLEVNTKMAFVTAGMGGGTGTGGAPIISKICKDLGILTVGIVTTPFAYEGRKRQLQAEEGIKNLKNYVDTLLVISNDKLRHQFGNLKMREAFAKADNVLATAAKCITDVINSTGQINVDFADVCTVMKNGGVAILGNAACEGEDRAQRAIEEALNSPLLNDNEISGAKWILININSAEGEHEFTMDEVDVIQNYLLSQAGDHSDVILGLGYDNTLGNKIGITLIATGFEHRDPFVKPAAPKTEVKKEEKVVMTLGGEPAKKAEKPQATQTVLDTMAPTLVDDAAPAADSAASAIEEAAFEMPYLQQNLKTDVTETPTHATLKMDSDDAELDREKQELNAKKQALNDKFEQLRQNILGGMPSQPKGGAHPSFPQSPASGGYLSRPSNIYAQAKNEPIGSKNNDETNPANAAKHEDEESFDMQLVIRNDGPSAADAPMAPQTQLPAAPKAEEPAAQDKAEDEKRKAAERLQKLRNLSFNLNAADPNNEFEAVPAYIRRNMELGANTAHVENFYSNYTVKPDGENSAQISTINSFLDGKKPD